MPPHPAPLRRPLRLLIRMAALWVMFLLLMSATPSGHADPPSRPILTIALEDVHFSPYHFRSREGHWVGVNVDTVRAVAASLGYGIRIEAYPWARVVEFFEQGRGSGVMDLLHKPERERFLAYVTEPLAHEVTQLFVPRDSGFTHDGTLSSLEGRDVGVVRGYFYGGELEAADRVGKIPFSSQNVLVRNVAQGRLPLGIGTRAAIQSEANALGVAERIRFLEPPVNRIPNFLAFIRTPHGEELARRFTEALKSFKASPAYRDILARYAIDPAHW